jgi:hypothetical protein
MQSKTICLSGCLLLSIALGSCSIMETVHDLQGGGTPVPTSHADTITYPVDFPLPKYPNSRATAASDSNVENARIRSVMMVSTVDADTICGYYTAWFKKNGWIMKSPAVSQEICTFIAAQKSGQTANIVAMHPKDSKQTTLTINISTELSAK